MKLNKAAWLSGLWYFGFYFFIFSFFLVLGSDVTAQIQFRLWWGGVLLVAFLFLPQAFDGQFIRGSFPLFLFFSFTLFELMRLLWGVAQLQTGHMGGEALLLERYLTAPARWFFCFGFFSISYSVFCQKKTSSMLLWLVSASGFFLSMCILPALIMTGQPWYLVKAGNSVFFPPFFYLFGPISKYLIGSFVHVNYTGDVMALGVFAALGILFYQLSLMVEALEKETRPNIFKPSLWLPLTFALITSAAVVTLLSRGTIVCFSVCLGIFLCGLLVKYPSRKQLVFVSVVIALVIAFLWWAGNLTQAGREVSTLTNELRPKFSGSFSFNVEGAKRAIRIYRRHPGFGVGTGGYEFESLKYATRGTESWMMIKFKAMCHYVQLLAEEGAGAFIYFLFILVYYLEMISKLIQTKSRFQFIAGLALVCACSMVLSHAGINHLMERFSIAMLVYILMGASLAVLRKDFKHS